MFLRDSIHPTTLSHLRCLAFLPIVESCDVALYLLRLDQPIRMRYLSVCGRTFVGELWVTVDTATFDRSQPSPHPTKDIHPANHSLKQNISPIFPTTNVGPFLAPEGCHLGVCDKTLCRSTVDLGRTKVTRADAPLSG